MSFQPCLRFVAAITLALVVNLAAGEPAQAQPRPVDPPALTEALANGGQRPSVDHRQCRHDRPALVDDHGLRRSPSTPVTPAPRILLMWNTPALTDPHIAALQRRGLAYTAVNGWVSL
ncbi:MAG: hypothetical protein IPG61_15130 [bacterium]|nr:hypothetical protein [bacterium]